MHPKLAPLLSAIAKHPELEYALWVEMHDRSYYGEWEPLPGDPETWVLSHDQTGGEAAQVQVTPDGMVRWHVGPGGGHESGIEAAMAAAEAVLHTKGWRPVPPLQNAKSSTPKSGIGAWFYHEEDRSWSRSYSNGNEAARVFRSPDRSSTRISWNTYTVGVVAPASLLDSGGAPNMDTAKHRADISLVAHGALHISQVVSAPEDIPF